MEMPAQPQQFCPLCGAEVPSSARYPRHVCPACYEKAADVRGRKLEFYNVSFSGGYEARYTDTHEPYDSHECYIDGVKCHADEARFGGIVISPVEKSSAQST